MTSHSVLPELQWSHSDPVNSHWDTSAQWDQMSPILLPFSYRTKRMGKPTAEYLPCTWYLSLYSCSPKQHLALLDEQSRLPKSMLKNDCVLSEGTDIFTKIRTFLHDRWKYNKHWRHMDYLHSYLGHPENL